MNKDKKEDKTDNSISYSNLSFGIFSLSSSLKSKLKKRLTKCPKSTSLSSVFPIDVETGLFTIDKFNPGSFQQGKASKEEVKYAID